MTATRIVIPRRSLLIAAATAPIACGPPAPKTPLAHLYGDGWVHGAYELYAGKYLGVQKGAEDQSFASYRTLAERGVTALDGLQDRGVPFFVRVSGDDGGFVIERSVPERLTYTADMDDAQRTIAKAAWSKARDHIQTDYAEIESLNGALTTMLKQLQRVRTAIDEGEKEEFRLVQQRVALGAGGPPPFQLPYQVSQGDYADVLALLLERLHDDRRRLSDLESSIIAVGLVARATDDGSGSLAANLDAMLLAVAADASATAPRAATYPTADAREAALAKGKDLSSQIAVSPAYVAWQKAEAAKQYEQIGSMLAIIDSVTHIPVSKIYQQAITIWKGDADYLSYLKTVASLVPGGGKAAELINKALTLTDKARQLAGDLPTNLSAEALVAAAKKRGGGVLNAAGGKTHLGKQLVFYENEADSARAKARLADASVLRPNAN